MTEKVKLTQEVADAIDYALNKGRYDHESLILSHAETELQDNPWTQAYKPLNEISLLKMVDALRIGFEVEPEFKPGQKVMVLWSGHGTEEMYEVVECDGDYVKIENGSDFNSAPVDIVRLATPEEIKAEKERRLWAKIGREVGEFRSKDIRINKNGEPIIINNTNQARMLFEKGKLKGFYPVESFISFEECESNA